MRFLSLDTRTTPYVFFPSFLLFDLRTSRHRRSLVSKQNQLKIVRFALKKGKERKVDHGSKSGVEIAFL